MRRTGAGGVSTMAVANGPEHDERGAGLVGLLAVVGVLGVLAALVWGSLQSLERLTGQVRKLPTAAGVGGTAVRLPGDGAAQLAQPAHPALPALRAACHADHGSIAKAAALRQARAGGPATSISQLVVEGLLPGEPGGQGYRFELEVVGGRPTGTVLVNGAPAPDGCDALETR